MSKVLLSRCFEFLPSCYLPDLSLGPILPMCGYGEVNQWQSVAGTAARYLSRHDIVHIGSDQKFSLPTRSSPSQSRRSISSVLSEDIHGDNFKGGRGNGAVRKAIPRGSSVVFAFNECENPNAYQLVTGPEGY